MDERYVVVGHGRHYDDVPPPNKGIYRGTARERLIAEVYTRSATGGTMPRAGEEVRTIDLRTFAVAPARRAARRRPPLRRSRPSGNSSDPRRRATPVSNLFDDVPRALPAERVDVLLDEPTVRLERIVSTSHATPPGQWFDQDGDEWVVVLRGRARLRIEGETEARSLGVGDHVLLRAHVRHRVEWTEPTEPTIWLALHYPSSDRK